MDDGALRMSPRPELAARPDRIPGRAIASWLLVGLMLGFSAAFFRSHKQAVLASRAAEGLFEQAAYRYEVLGPRFGSEDYLTPALAELNRACEAAQPGQRMEERVGDWLVSKGLHEEATEFYLRALARRPSAPLAKNAGRAAATARDTDAVAQAYGVWIRLAPRDPEPYNSLGYYYAVEGVRLDEAERLVRQGLRLCPPGSLTLLELQDSLAWVYYRQQRYAEAWGIMQEIARTGLHQLDPIIYEHYLAIRREAEQTPAPIEQGPQGAAKDA